ncbi:MAG: DUF4034 domain-containing protein [Verrucomicrobiota bacterium]
MTTQPPPLQDKTSSAQSSQGGGKCLLISILVAVLFILLLVVCGLFLYQVYTKVNQGTVRHEANTQKSNQMPPEFLELLNAMHSVLDEPVNAMPIGKVSEQSLTQHTDKTKALLDAGKYGELDDFLSLCYTDKLMTKEGFFMYREMIRNLVITKDLSEWVAATGSSHAHISAGLKEKDLAWESRGSGYSNSVTETGWQGFDLHLDKATEHYELAVKEDEYNSAALNLLMSIGLGRGQLEGILPEIIKMGVERTPEDGELPARISYYLTPRWHGSRQQVIDFIAEDLKKWPNSGGKFDCLLDRLSLASEWGNSKFLLANSATKKVHEKIMRKYQQSWPQGSLASKKIAQTLMRYKCHKEAAAFLKEHEKDFHEKSDYYLLYGKASFFTKDYARARDLLNKAVATESIAGHAYFYLGRNANQMMNYPAGKEAYLKAAELLPLSEHWERGFTYAGLGMIASRLSDHKSAKSYAEKAVQIDPSQAYSWYILGFTEYKLGNKKPAKVNFTKAIKLASKYDAIIKKECPQWKSW